VDKKQKILEIKQRAESDLEFFINLVHPQRVLGQVHKDLISWWTRQDAKSHQLCLLPRDHGKSAMAGYRAAWELTKNPAIRILYISSTSNLAAKQLKFIKDILDHPTYRRYWPEMTHPDEGKREKWTEWEISVDHPKRKAEAIRDPSIFIAGLTTGIVGLHCDIAVLDDVVTGDNADKEAGREKVKTQYSFLSSIEGAEAKEIVVGTRYNPNDLYGEMMSMNLKSYSPEGELVKESPLYELFERVVEDVGDGSGQFLWPRQQRHDGNWFGFNREVLEKKKAQYLNKLQFRAQYYNDPNDSDNPPIDKDWFQHYEKTSVVRKDGFVYYKDQRLNVFAAVDFAFSLARKADYTAIVVVGVDTNNNYYVLDIDRFKTEKIKDYFDRILKLYQKWGFKKLRAEVNAAQKIIVRDLKDNYIRPFGLSLSIDEFRPSRHLGTKEERIEAALNAKYQNLQMWHYKGGNCELLEEELVLQKPPHDDIKDCLASAIEIAIAPSMNTVYKRKRPWADITHHRFGGMG